MNIYEYSIHTTLSTSCNQLLEILEIRKCVLSHYYTSTHMKIHPNIAHTPATLNTIHKYNLIPESPEKLSQWELIVDEIVSEIIFNLFDELEKAPA